MKRFLTMLTLTGILLLGFALPHAAQANTVIQNGITCVGPIGDSALNGTYPDDGSKTTAGHDYWCGTAINQTTQAYQMLQSVSGLADKTVLQTAGITYYLFGTRAEEAQFWGTGSPFYDNVSYCGHTAAQVVGGVSTIKIAIWNACSNKWTGALDTNIWMNEVTSHESGHGLDFAVAKQNGTPTANPSTSTAFRALVSADLTNLAQTACLTFGNSTPSGVESGWPATHLPAVCNFNNVENATYVKKSNVAIAALVSAYFVNPSPASLKYQDVWAQLMVLQGGGPGSPDIVPVTDSLLSNFKCSAWAARSYYLFNVPPAVNTYPTGCPQNPGAF